MIRQGNLVKVSSYQTELVQMKRYLTGLDSEGKIVRSGNYILL